MNCGRFERILADFQEGKLCSDERSAAVDHLEKCPACRRLLDVARGNIDILPEERRNELTRSILARTSGPVCPRVEPGLWDFAAGTMVTEDSRMATLHLDHCPACRALAGNLAVLRQVLPTMAEVDPGESFTREVVRATGGCRPRESGLRARLPAWWNRMVQRPRFALEAAYLGTLVFVLAFGGPFPSFRSVPFERISSVIQPSANYILSVWAATDTSISNQLRELASVITVKNQAVFNSISKLAKNWALVSVSTLDENAGSVGSWCREEGGALLSVWTDLSRSIPRARP